MIRAIHPTVTKLYIEFSCVAHSGIPGTMYEYLQIYKLLVKKLNVNERRYLKTIT